MPWIQLHNKFKLLHHWNTSKRAKVRLILPQNKDQQQSSKDCKDLYINIPSVMLLIPQIKHWEIQVGNLEFTDAYSLSQDHTDQCLSTSTQEKICKIVPPRGISSKLCGPPKRLRSITETGADYQNNSSVQRWSLCLIFPLCVRQLSKLVLEVQGERTECRPEAVSTEILPWRFYVVLVTWYVIWSHRVT